jgi:acyl-CoA synthetase (AMP-forming)/AMP-acid ligase II
VQRGQPGELLYAFDANDINDKLQGYYRNKQATGAKVMRDVLKKGDAWFRTGDLLRWDHDGRWLFVDQIGDTYRWKGENDLTAEVGKNSWTASGCPGGECIWG